MSGAWRRASSSLSLSPNLLAAITLHGLLLLAARASALSQYTDARSAEQLSSAPVEGRQRMNTGGEGQWVNTWEERGSRYTPDGEG